PAPAAKPTPAPAPVAGIVKTQDPSLLIARGTNAEMQWVSMKGQGYATPVDRFFVRNHTRTPLLDPNRWFLQINGDGLAGSQPVNFTLKQLEEDFESVELDAAIECAGNGRSFFGSQQGRSAPGTAWTLGAIGVGTWRGVRLADVLEKAGLAEGVVDVMPIGLDPEVIGSDGRSQGRVRRPIPIKKALHDVIIALEMNGRVLPADHGFPARLIVPGWVGIANTKWLGQIQVSKTPLFSAWNTTQYRLVGTGYPTDIAPLTANPLKSAFELPSGAVFPAGTKRTLTGRSWSGRWLPKRVEVSTNSGDTWKEAKLSRRNEHDAWVQWQVDWTPKSPGKRKLLARAYDAHGNTQPDATRFNRDGYWFDAVVQHPVTIS
ncbi:MAG: molybdopterin-dependent oxidoreductase, partial [Solirubrobacteraceae bacterium]|nr:molybdopterin-dependent oxidoreductase [Solirubrobacteraceae bacterium]